MDAKRIAGDLGRSSALGTIAFSLSIEASLTNSRIFAYPVPLEPPFRVFDPIQTFQRTAQREVTAVVSPDTWVTRRMILPLVERVDVARTSGVFAGLAGCPTRMCWEMIATRTAASFFLSAPPSSIGSLGNAWLASFPESALAEAADPWLSIGADDLVLVDLYSPAPYHRAIRGSASLWPTLFRLCPDLREHDVLFLQLLLESVRYPWQENMQASMAAEQSLGHRSPYGRTVSPKNLDEPLSAVAIRLGTTNPGLVPNLESISGILTADGKPFRYRTAADYQRVHMSPGALLGMLRRRENYTSGQLLTCSELALLAHTPDQSAGISVHLDFRNGLGVPARLRAPGQFLGVNTNQGVPITVSQPWDEPNKNCWFIGRSRSGKSTAMIHKCRALAEAGLGFAVIDPHGTTAHDVLHALADFGDRIEVLAFDGTMPIAFNPFDHDDEEDFGQLTMDYVHSFKQLFEATGFHRMMHLLGMAIYALFVLKANLATVTTLFAKTPAGEGLRRRVIATVKNAEVRRFWESEFASYGAEATAPIVNRLSALLLNDHTYRTFAQTHNKVNIASAMDNGKILIITTPPSIEVAGIVGGILIAQALHAAFRRTGTPRARQSFVLFIDEFQRFITSARTLQGIIDEASKGGLSVTLANQEQGQIPNELLKAIYSIPNIFVFSVNLLDAKQLAHLFNGHVAPETLASLPTGHVYARIGQDIVNFQSPPPLAPADPAAVARIIADGQAKYCALPTSPDMPARKPRIIDTL